MDSDRAEKLLKEAVRLSKQNNKMLKSIKRSMFLGGVIKLVVWLIILGLPILFYYYFIRPYVSGALDIYNSIGNVVGNTQGSTSGVSSILELLKSKQ